MYVADTLTELVGYDRTEPIRSELSLIKPDESVTTASKHLRRVLSSTGPNSVTFEINIVTSDGKIIPCKDHMDALLYKCKQFQRTIGMLCDIPDCRNQE